ncbi:hypothetical protein FNJ88_04160 [Chryseobacterium sp. SNU WT5]|uniref:hypothetical protein n=1 Tax=Chryseobacterium sp. SNU WT5 TaxID=2594269 RepID=UPI00117C063F|nr:hypothetical protein [Chryseobacterium sp. SNU WT5]QDP84782.1 hypothetical protein FNJ88_04160 [Chryseobacterium sp. SNU WT5]
MNSVLTISHNRTSQGFLTKTYPLRSNFTTVNIVRRIIRSWAVTYNVVNDISEITLQYNDSDKITYGSIETKSGLAGKKISFEELFERGGKIFS